MKIVDNLLTGKQNAQTAKQLAALYGIKDIRTITRQIEIERRLGHPILASNDTNSPGYYLPESEADIRRYLRSLDCRLRNAGASRDGIQLALDKYTGQQRMGDTFDG